MPDRPRLDSWKAIAKYLDRDVRTVIRWEQRRALPVYRVPGGRLARVFAYPDELSRWLESSGPAEPVPEAISAGSVDPIPPIPGDGTGASDATAPRSSLWMGVAALVAVAVTTLTAWTWMRADEPPTQLTLAGRELRALDASGQMRWAHQFDASEVSEAPWRWSHIANLTADNSLDVVAAVEITPTTSNQHSGQVLSFAADGRLQWSAVAGDRVTFRGGEYGAPWVAEDLAVYRVNSQARLAWTVHHYTWWPSLLITMEPGGKRIGTYVNSGWMRGAVPSVDGRYLFVSGVTNSRQAHFLAVLDAANPSGHSPEPPGSAMECVRCPEGDPLQYFVLPRTDVSRQQPFPADGPTVMTFDDGTVQVHALTQRKPEHRRHHLRVRA